MQLLWQAFHICGGTGYVTVIECLFGRLNYVLIESTEKVE